MVGDPPKRFSFSIRTVLLVTFVMGVFLAGFRNPNNTTVIVTTATLVVSICLAWYTSLRDWPACNPWILGFAVAATCLSLDLYFVPSDWQDAAFSWIHPEDAAEHAQSRASGLNKEAMDFTSILRAGAILGVATIAATLLAAIRPKRIPSGLLFGCIAVVTLGLLPINNGVAFAVSLSSGTLLAAAWFVTLRDLRAKHVLATAFAAAATCFLLLTRGQMLPDFGLYEVLHRPPAAISDRHQEVWIFNAMYRDCLALWFGAVVAFGVRLGAQAPRPPADNPD